jgi:hypothetical protein
MNVKSRLESIEKQIGQHGTCRTCGGQHVAGWFSLIKASESSGTICDCPACCGWVTTLAQTVPADA